MHKPKQEEAVTSLHDLSAVDLIAGYKAKQFSPSEVLEDVIAHDPSTICEWSGVAHAASLRRPSWPRLFWV